MGTVTAADPHTSFLADKDAKVFVAGHRGLVGSAVVRRLLSLGFTSVVVRTHAELDLTRQADVEAFFAAERPRYVVLAAAKVGGIHANSTFPADFIAANLQIQTNVVDAALRSGSVRKLLFLGSSCIYPKFAPQPITEGALLSGPLEPTNEWYAVAKIAGIKMCQAYRIQHGLDAVSAMPTNLYGPHDNFHPENSHVLPALIRRFHEAKACDAPEVVVWGSGSPLREFLHVDDLADAVIFLMDQYSGLEHVNVGSGSEVAIKELAELVKEVVGFQGKLVWDSSKPDGTPRKLMDSSKIQGMGWKPKIALKEGLVETYKCTPVADADNIINAQPDPALSSRETDSVPAKCECGRENSPTGARAGFFPPETASGSGGGIRTLASLGPAPGTGGAVQWRRGAGDCPHQEKEPVAVAAAAGGARRQGEAGARR
ncbi:probable GDP-L-fucose synthase 1 isoform X2 [Panicum virgatum]|uniref:probable GDP-L-fucose synthase 1 isoform X2 n=2 Tax=Panicum virgatum TaxID=38727 RepID=UPI0019D50DBA|nr:probable GDP-L-fucose synthase 1 isoform X2 [Panicum virgatum]